MRTSLRPLLVLAWPVVVARSSQSVIGFADALMTAHLGEATLAAVTTGAMNFFALVMFPMGVAAIVQSFAAQLEGRGDLVAARRYAWYGLGLAAASQLLGLLAIPALPTVLGWFSYEPAVRAQMADYLAIRLCGVGLVVAVEVLGNWYGGLGNTHLHMVAGVVAMVVNVFLNWVLIDGNLGAPALGAEGAAWASVVAAGAGLSLLVLVFAKRWFVGARGAAVDWPRRLGLRWSELGRMLRFGVPNGLNWFFEFAAFLLFINVVIAHLGTAALAAMMVVFSINSVSFMPAFGLASSGAILVGQAIGEGRKDDVPGIARTTASVAALWQGSVGLLYFLFPGPLMETFARGPHDSSDLVAIGTTMLALSAAWQLFDALGLTLGEALRAAGDTTWTFAARLTLAWVVFMPTALVAVLVFGGDHVEAMLCLILYIALLAGFFFYRFRGGAWRRIDLTGVDELV